MGKQPQTALFGGPGGLMMNTKVHPADHADLEEARVLLERVNEPLPTLRYLYADAGYRVADLQRRINWRLELTFEVVQRKPRWG